MHPNLPNLGLSRKQLQFGGAEIIVGVDFVVPISHENVDLHSWDFYLIRHASRAFARKGFIQVSME